MSHTRDFLAGFSPLPEGFALPRRLCADYEPLSSLSRREERLVLLMRRPRDGALFVCKRGPWEEMETEYRLLARLAPVLPGAVPEPEDCFQEDGAGYLLRAYLPGETLAQYRERVGGCSPEECGELGRKLCGLLEVLHSQEPPVIHRDIKPENVILLEGGGLGLIDFGAARQYTPGQGTDTRHLGTCTTAAPEQYGYAQTDRRTDLYAAGATLLWLAAGTYDRAALSSLPRWLGRTLERAMAFDPADRWPSARGMGDALARKFPGKRMALGAAAAVCALLALLGASALGRDRAPKPTDAVDFSSQVLEAAVRAELDLPQGTVTYADLARVERLAAVGTETFSREETFGCRVGPYVGEVWKGDGPRGDVADLSLLSRMPNLTELYLCRQQITDVTALTDLPLVTLALCDNEISDVAPLGDIDTLEQLYLGENPAGDHSALARLWRLQLLNLDSLHGACIDSFSFLGGLGLGDLSLCRLRPGDGDWTALSELENLHILHLWDAPEKAVAAARDLPGLICLTAGDWGLGDLSALAGMTGLESLNIYGGLDSLAGAETLTGLEIVYLSDSAVTDLTPLADLPRLRRLELHRVEVADLSPLSAMESLEEVGVDPEQEAAARTALPAGAELLPF